MRSKRNVSQFPDFQIAEERAGVNVLLKYMGYKTFNTTIFE